MACRASTAPPALSHEYPLRSRMRESISLMGSSSSTTMRRAAATSEPAPGECAVCRELMEEKSAAVVPELSPGQYLRVPMLGTMTELAIEVRGLRKSYGAVEAVRGVDLEVETGEIFALLGP